MGGKTKHTQRTKNNAKPSSSSRSAELLGTLPNFVGFSAHSDLGMVPFAPGFATAENMQDSFDASISPEFQIVLRKLSKKDPMTKKKALLEFYGLINGADMDTIKVILPLWPKFYHNLANDIEHNVRELAQTVLQLLVSKCKRAVAPYLKQLMPVWLASHFDNYAPAASIARNCFRETFDSNANRTQEVCLHCQAEIVEYASRNLTFHTAATLSSGKNLSPAEAEQKYQRVILCSLKELSFLVEHTANAPDLSQLQSSLEPLLKQSKFWSLSKHKIPAIKAAWFELFYHLLQSVRLAEVTTLKKDDLLSVCFQNIDESDPLVAPQVWGCILVLQSNHDDWHATVNFKTMIIPKLSWLLRNGFNKNAHAICPNLLPFFSKLSQESLQEVDVNEFYMQFFDDLKSAICCTTQTTISKSDHAIIIKTYFECLRFLLQRINNATVTNTADQLLAMRLMQQNILDPIAWFLSNECAWTKFFFLHAAALVAFLTDRQNVPSSLYAQLLCAFWKQVCNLITESLKNQSASEHSLEVVLQFLNDLHLASPSLEDHYVKFAESAEVETLSNPKCESRDMKASSSAAIQRELSQLANKLVCMCLANISSQTSFKYISHVCSLTKMFPDIEFYKNISAEGSLLATLDLFMKKLDLVDEKAAELLVDVLFAILQKMDKGDQFSYINLKLLHIKRTHVQLMVLQRLVSYPLCVEPEVRTLLSQREAREIILSVAQDVVANQCKEKLNLLHKCFFQTDAGEILIDQPTVDAVLGILSEPLATPKLNDIVDACGSFIAQIMPVVCSNNNSSHEMRSRVFLKLFKFTMERTANDFISEDTLWEITTCWQDALSSQDITIDTDLLQMCTDVVERRVQAAILSSDAIVVMAEAMAKFITCSTEHIEVENERMQKIDEIISILFFSPAKGLVAVQSLKELSLFLEALRGTVTLGVELSGKAAESIDMTSILRRTLLNFCTILKLVCSGNMSQKYSGTETTDDEVPEDFCDPNENLLKSWSELLITKILQCIDIASAAESFISGAMQIDFESLILELSERVKIFMKEKSEIVCIVKERMLQEAAKELEITPCRSLLYLVHHEEYAQFDENATILLAENLSEYFLKANAVQAYVYSLQYLLPNLEQRSITTQSAIMGTDPKAMWIKAAVFRCLLRNNFSGSYNERADKAIVASTLQFIMQVAEKLHAQKDLLLYNVEIHKQSHDNVLNTVEFINLLATVLESFPLELSIKNWDAVRIGLSSWVLSVSKSIEDYTNPKVAIFIVSIFKLFAALMRFVILEKQKSSTELLKNVIEEWENLFAREVNLVLFKSFYRLCNTHGAQQQYLLPFMSIMEEIVPGVRLIDYRVVYNFCKSSTKITLDNLCIFLLKNLSNSIHTVRVTCVQMLRQLTQFFVAEDLVIFEQKSESLEDQANLTKWHYLNRFEDYIARYDFPIRKYLDEFSFKPTEIGSLVQIERNEAFSYLLLWDCIIFVCANSPVSLRSVYTNWLHENKYEENFLHFLFRAMPVEILKNHDSKIMNSDIFKGLSWVQVEDRNLPLEKYVCHLYTEVLRKLPAVVRKWWSTSPSRQKTFVDKLTTNFVSLLICNEELKAIAGKKEKHENMQVTVHTSTREVLAVYSIDEARMELVITLAQNYPLGGVKVECGKQIGGRSSSRNVGMQLTIFLTHQNGTIFDGLTLWKNNLDQKFEGVEECYVCYTVIHQDTCQLPKLTCKTCKKKFHGPCLYKWFTTSSKSTCPICRNVF